MKKKDWERFRVEKIDAWLKPVKLPPKNVGEADRAAAEAMPRLEHEGKWWKEDEVSVGKRGKRGEYWVSNMLIDLGAKFFGPVSSEEVEKYKTPYDLYVVNLGTMEVKTSPIGENYVNIKRAAWDRSPSTHMIALKTMDKSMETFSLKGFLYGHEVYNLKWNPSPFKGYADYYSATEDDLRPAEKLLEFVLEVSEHNPDLKQKGWYRAF